ncbi:MAG: hypothetical protein AAGE83_08480 [Pseudomonadota bacterium]
MGNAIKVIGGLAAIIFVLLAFGPGGFMAGGGGKSTGVGTIGIAEEHKKRQASKSGGGGGGSGRKGVADERFIDAPGGGGGRGGGSGGSGGGSGGGGGGSGGGSGNGYDFFGTLARVLGLGS